jgi:nicotinamidase/pyrazinamidase
MSSFKSAMSNGKNILLIIDPQVDFHPGGSLGIDGANEDSQRIADLIMKNINTLDEIYVTLDSHHRNHIAHAIFWENKAGEKPAAFSEITYDQIVNGEWFPRDPTLLEHCKFYAKALEDANRFKIRIWPEHCLIGTPGHAVVPSVNAALQEWAGSRNKQVHYVLKGSNCLTEMYSAIAADVPLDNDKSTQKNPVMMAEFTSARKLIVCGEAKSHCVNFTLRDIMIDWSATGRGAEDVILLLDGCTAVYGCGELAETFERDMRDMGVTCINSTDVKL